MPLQWNDVIISPMMMKLGNQLTGLNCPIWKERKKIIQSVR